jgi:putative ABC transport system substrate-binding protein
VTTARAMTTKITRRVSFGNFASRRAALSGAAAWLFAAGMPAGAQHRAAIPRVGVLTPIGSDVTPSFKAFREELRKLGYIEGESIILDFRFAKGRVDALPVLAAELVKIPVDVIVVDGVTAARATVNITQSIPIVQAAGGDPVAAGIAASYARPGGNFTGFSIRSDELAGKRLELLWRGFSGITRVTVMLDPTSVVTQGALRATEETAANLNILLTTLPASTPDALNALVPVHLAGKDGLVVLPSAIFWHHRATIVALAAAARVPGIYPEREYADDGGLMAYGPNIPDTFRRAAGYVHLILRGTRPADLPIEGASKFDYIVNLRTARELGLSPSRSFFIGVSEVIE